MTIFDKLEIYKKVMVEVFFKAVSVPLMIWDFIPFFVKVMFLIFIGLVLLGLCYLGWTRRHNWQHLDY